jgi:DNA processing protein
MTTPGASAEATSGGADDSEELPSEAYAAALAGQAGLTAARLRSLLRRRTPRDVWASLLGDAPVDPVLAEAVERSPGLPQRWQAIGRRHPPRLVWERCRAAGVSVHVLGRPGYPAVLAADREAPAVLFSCGDLAALGVRRVAIIGTRNATATGRSFASELGAGLAAAGVAVVSGLARGVDGWAHRGALSVPGAAPVGVVACGLDVVYPAEHRRLWADVGSRGLLLAEVPPGTSPEAFRFPLRNRILAALSEIVVVVESRAKGGSLLTVDAATRRGVPVMAVPGSPRTPAAEGTNRLIADGAAPVLDTTDVLVALGLSTGRQGPSTLDDRPPPSPLDQEVLDLLGAEPLDIGRVVALTGRTLADVALALSRLEITGWVTRTGGWFERAGVTP